MMGATGLELFGFRVSDVAAVLFMLSIIFYNIDSMRFGLSSLQITLFALLLIIIFRTLYYCGSLASDDVIDHDTLIVPLALSIGLMFGQIIRFDWIKFSYRYSVTFIFIYGVVYPISVYFGWYVNDWEGRLSFFSLNPNQFALFLAPVPFFVYRAYQENMLKKHRLIFFWFVSLLLLVLCVGKSLAISLPISIWVAWVLKKLIEAPAQKIRFYIPFLIIFSGLILYGAYPIFNDLYNGDFIGSQENQGDIRVSLWLNGLKAWFDSLLFGHGPGHYSGNTGPYEKYEAHNTFIDIAAAYGFLGLALFVILIYKLLKAAIKNSDYVMFAASLSLCFQLFFHFYARQPAFWIWLVIMYNIALSRNKEYVIFNNWKKL